MAHLTILRIFMYLLRSKKVGTLDWARPFPADASWMSRVNKGPALSALSWPMTAMGPGRADSAWALR